MHKSPQSNDHWTNGQKKKTTFLLVLDSVAIFEFVHFALILANENIRWHRKKIFNTKLKQKTIRTDNDVSIFSATLGYRSALEKYSRVEDGRKKVRGGLMGFYRRCFAKRTSVSCFSSLCALPFLFSPTSRSALSIDEQSEKKFCDRFVFSVNRVYSISRLLVFAGNTRMTSNTTIIGRAWRR